MAGINKEELDRQKQIANQWREFAKTQAYKEFRDYIAMQDYFAIAGAKGPVVTFTEEGTEQPTFDPIKTSNLLQRSVGYDIVTTYVDGYITLAA